MRQKCGEKCLRLFFFDKLWVKIDENGGIVDFLLTCKTLCK